MERQIVKAIIFQNTKVLLIYLPKKDVYELPGGVVENNETLEDALYREIMEETGYRIEKINCKFKELIDDNGNNIHFFECEISNLKIEENFTDEEKNELIYSEWCWINDVINKNKKYINENLKSKVFREKRTLNILLEYKETKLYNVSDDTLK